MNSKQQARWRDTTLLRRRWTAIPGALYIIIIMTTASIVAGCSHQRPTRGLTTQPDTIYTEKNIVKIHRSTPNQAMAMIDSAVTMGNITWKQGEYLKALTYYGGYKNYARARQQCLDMLTADEVKRDTVLQERIYIILVSIALCSGNDAEVIRLATEGSRLAHIIGDPQEVGGMTGFAARAMARMGRVDEAVALMRSTLSEMRDIDTYHAVNSHHTVGMKLLHVLLDAQRYDEMPAVCDVLLQRIEAFRNHPESFSIPEGFDPADFTDMAYGQTCAFCCATYALLGRTDEVRRYELMISQTQWSHTVDCDRMMATTYRAMHDWLRFNAANDRMEREYRDTLSNNYLTFLIDKSQGIKLQGRTAEALHLLERAMVIKDSLFNRATREQIAQLSVKYHLQEEQFARQQAETQARLLRLLLAASLLLIALSAAFAIYFLYTRRKTIMKSHSLVRLIDELEGQKEHKKTDTPDQALFESIDNYIREERLFADINLQRQTVINHFGIGRHTLNQLLTVFTDEPSFTSYVNNIRIDEALRLLNENDGKTLTDIAAAVGLTPSNLRQLFKRRFGITPTEYRKNR